MSNYGDMETPEIYNSGPMPKKERTRAATRPIQENVRPLGLVQSPTVPLGRAKEGHLAETLLYALNEPYLAVAITPIRLEISSCMDGITPVFARRGVAADRTEPPYFIISHPGHRRMRLAHASPTCYRQSSTESSHQSPNNPRPCSIGSKTIGQPQRYVHSDHVSPAPPRFPLKTNTWTCRQHNASLRHKAGIHTHYTRYNG
ncbi:hypothetical protein ACRALDRAFT_2022782 [Sodiomyces alcalophilus JCM 7366]|uniref:uncharacterized protein n=1 Tax=Sodiomyces alcalophilus JCM 7366 TaxID=591952 RepID=UPI0039B50180